MRPRPNGRFERADYPTAEAARLLAHGVPGYEVARRFGVSEALVSKVCPRARKAWLRRQDRLIRDLVRGGRTRAQAAKITRCSFATAQRAYAGMAAVTAPARLRHARRLAAELSAQREADPLRIGATAWESSGEKRLFPTWD